ncbi:His-Xaa-Ser repeat protein HxsA2 (plasmid) [Cupriavidus sp. P-10]|uniref:His-Xaa-Ser repeat protein HxsA2 n=1 Tax=unclassified Cupriavidus TaxID=2640874 RepID=UPI0018F1DA7F|nr:MULTISPECIES: His-Xaa-Ser repeat protein HxsA2 [unclassified Cupriavidus]BDB29440.1 His-Xaa-Ser repeat protein HxsA2 [Cupriavidus sp. P-10]
MKGFLKAFAAVAAGFAAQSSNAAQLPNQVPTHPIDASSTAVIGSKTPEVIAVTDSAGDAFNFVLKRASDDQGSLMAYHQSHSSHSSHRSHSSHYSSRY